MVRGFSYKKPDIFSVMNFSLKSRGGFRKWTKKNVQNRKVQKSFEKTSLFRPL
jgi:hypothetical protein